MVGKIKVFRSGGYDPEKPKPKPPTHDSAPKAAFCKCPDGWRHGAEYNCPNCGLEIRK